MRPALRTISFTLLVIGAMGGICLAAYVIAQQSLRQSANDPQIQMAEDGATALAGGAAPASLVIRGVALIDPAVSLAPFLAVYDAKGKVLESSGVIDGKPPMPPMGVLGSAKDKGENRITWQPATGTRIATVIVAVDGKFTGFVLAGRSLKEIEKRDERAQILAVIAWLASSGMILIALAL